MLRERDPTQQAIDRAVVVWADEVRHDHQRDQAVRVINQYGQAVK